MTEQPGPTSRDLAVELAFIQAVMETAIEFEQLYGRPPSAREVQRQPHGKPAVPRAPD